MRTANNNYLKAGGFQQRHEAFIKSAFRQIFTEVNQLGGQHGNEIHKARGKEVRIYRNLEQEFKRQHGKG